MNKHEKKRKKLQEKIHDREESLRHIELIPGAIYRMNKTDESFQEEKETKQNNNFT